MESIDVEEAYRRYFPVIQDKCARMLRDSIEAHDLAQETFTRLWVHRKDLRDAQAVLAWTYRTATRLAVDRLRRNETARAALADCEPAAGGGLPLNEQLEARQMLQDIFQRMKRRDLEVLLLSRFDGLTQLEVAELLGISERSVRRTLQRVDAQLRKAKERA
ncbi:MAG: RNA polymerase sigma factor [Myxococcota bacterium]